MYHPTTRVLTVLELLQAHRQMSGPKLAERLEVDVRSVRRYITMLQDLGIPIEAERGRYGNYRLMRDRKSTRLNSSHVEISYAVFCLKKKKKKKKKKYNDNIVNKQIS